MQQSFILVAAAAWFPIVSCVAFGGPEQTQVIPSRALEGWTPKPTKGPSVEELRRRATNFYPETCGWLDKDADSAVSCPLGDTCMLYTASNTAGMVGCCSGANLQSCGWVNSCIDYVTIMSGGCDSNCRLNSFIKKCTDSESPFCVSWTYPSNNVKDYGCGTDIGSIFETVYQEATDSYDSSETTISLPTAAQSAVTGWQSTAGVGSATRSSYSSAFSSGTYHSSTTTTVRRISIGAIIGLALAGLFVLGIIAGLIIFCCLRQKKKKQLAANQQAIAAAQASRPQSQFYSQTPNPQTQGMQQMPPPMPAVPQTPQPGSDGYFAPPAQDPQKFNPQTQVHEYAVSPISNPPTPAPAYQQAYAAPNAAPRLPNHGAAEVDAISVPHAPTGGHGQVYEMGSGK